MSGRSRKIQLSLKTDRSYTLHSPLRPLSFCIYIADIANFWHDTPVLLFTNILILEDIFVVQDVQSNNTLIMVLMHNFLAALDLLSSNYTAFRSHGQPFRTALCTELSVRGRGDVGRPSS